MALPKPTPECACGLPAELIDPWDDEPRCHNCFEKGEYDRRREQDADDFLASWQAHEKQREERRR